MARKSSIDRLDPEIKAFIQAELALGAKTLDQLIASLQERFPVASHTGGLPSRSAMHRYGQNLDRRMAAVRASTEAAKLIAEHAGDDKDARSEAITAMVQTELLETMIMLQEAGDADVDPAKRLELLSKAAKNIAPLTSSSVRLKRFRAEVEEATRRKLLEEQRAKLDALGDKGGVTEATMLAIRGALGIT